MQIVCPIVFSPKCLEVTKIVPIFAKRNNKYD